MTMRTEAWNRLEALRERGISDTEILEYVICNYLPASESCDSLEGLANDYDFSFEEEETEEGEE